MRTLNGLLLMLVPLIIAILAFVNPQMIIVVLVVYYLWFMTVYDDRQVAKMGTKRPASRQA